LWFWRSSGPPSGECLLHSRSDDPTPTQRQNIYRRTSGGTLSFLDGVGSSEGCAAAVTRDRHASYFDTAREIVRRSPEIRRRYGVEALANAIWQERTSSNFRPIGSDAKALDGLNVQVAVCDEIASHKTSEVYDVLLTAMGKRSNPLLLAISTATGNNSGVGKQLWDYAVRVLEDTQQDERLFALIYTIDPEDDPWIEASWIKANPSWGQTVQPDAVRAIMRQARNNPAQKAAAKTRHLNASAASDPPERSSTPVRYRSVPPGLCGLGPHSQHGCFPLMSRLRPRQAAGRHQRLPPSHARRQSSMRASCG
jgi:hypothetical protein